MIRGSVRFPFPESSCMRMIELIEERPPLWNHALEECKDVELKTRLWEGVATELNIEVSVVKAKWRNLRDQFRHEYFQKSTGKKYSTWRYFPNMQFLIDEVIIARRQKPPGLINKSKNDDSLSQESLDNNIQAPYSTGNIEKVFIEQEPSLNFYSESSFNSNPPPPKPKKKRFILKRNVEENEVPVTGKRKTLERLVQLEEKKLKHMETSIAQTQDEDYHFAVSLVPYLKELPRHRKMLVRTKIQQIFCDECDATQTQQTVNETALNTFDTEEM